MSTAPPSSAPPLRSVDAQSFWATLRAALTGVELDYTRGSMPRAVWLLAIPMVLEMALESVFAVVDMFFVNKLGAAAVAAVGLTESMLTIVYAVGIGIAMSTTAMVARRVGEGDLAAAARAGGQAIGLVWIVGLLLGVPCVFLAPDLLRLIGGSEDVIAIGSGYTRLVLGGNVVVMLLFVNNAIFRGAGDPMIAMKSLWVANLANLVLDPLLIFGLGPIPALGVTGAGLATLCGRTIGVIYQDFALLRGGGRVRVDRAARRLDPVAMLTLLRLSAGGIGQFLIATSSWVFLNSIVTRFGDAAVAGYAVGLRILLFTYLPAWGLSNAAATLVGQNLGAAQPDRAKRAVYLTSAYNLVFLLGVMVITLLYRHELIAIFTTDPAVAAVGAECLRIFAYGYPMYALGMVLVQALNGAGDTVTPTWINVAAYWMVQVPLAWWLAKHSDLGPGGVFWSVVVGESLMTTLAFVAFRAGRWRRQVV